MNGFTNFRRLLSRMSCAWRPRFHREYTRGNPESRILFLVDHDGPTFHLYFDAPNRLMLEHGFCYGLLTHDLLSGISAGTTTRLKRLVFDSFRPDVVILSRFGLPSGEAIVREANRRRIPVVYHLDDDLLNPPASLGEEIRVRQRNPAVLTARRSLMQAANAIWASTPQLAAVLRGELPAARIDLGPTVPLLATMPRQRPQQHKTSFTIGYMGSRGHQRDLKAIERALCLLLEKKPTVRFETFGTIDMPASLRNAFPDRVRAWPLIADYTGFLHFLSKIDWDCGVAPLVHDRFNSCKTAVKFVEYTSAGIPVVAGDGAPYRAASEAGAALTAAPADWFKVLSLVVDQPQRLLDVHGRARHYCAQNHSLNRTVSELVSLLSGVMPSKATPSPGVVSQ